MPRSKKMRGKQRNQKKKAKQQQKEKQTMHEIQKAVEKEAELKYERDKITIVSYFSKYKSSCSHEIPYPSVRVYDKIYKFLRPFIVSIAHGDETPAHVWASYGAKSLGYEDNNICILILEMIKQGTDILLNAKDTHDESLALKFAEVIVCLEMVDYADAEVVVSLEAGIAKLNTGGVKHYQTKTRDLYGGGRRAVTRFFAKRINCGCLDSLYKDTKKKPKMGSCSYCMKESEFLDLMGCSRCSSIVHYCGEECQLAHWPRHKDLCDKFSYMHKKEKEQRKKNRKEQRKKKENSEEKKCDHDDFSDLPSDEYGNILLD